jgi:tripartite-type tricarboxylate transporter receptor subunit TctC
MTFVPYSGSSLAVNALLGEHMTSFFGNYTDVSEQLKAGKLRALAAALGTGIEPLPDVPTIGESSYKDFRVDIWFGLFTPAKTLKEIVFQFAGSFTAALRAPETKSKLNSLGLYPVEVCGAEFGALIRRQYEEYGRVIREANIRAEN